MGLAEPQKDGSYKVRWEYISDKNPRVIEIPPGIYHGYKALQPESIILYYLDQKYTPDDEWKVLPGHFGENWDTISKWLIKLFLTQNL